MATTPNHKKFDVIRTGYVKCNKYRWRDAKLVMFRPGIGIMSLEFKALPIGEKRDERDDRGNLIDFKVVVSEYRRKVGEIGCDFANGESYSGIVFYNSKTTELGFSKRSWRSGDIREIAPFALKMAGLPDNPKGYCLIAEVGEFWDRPSPIMSRTRVITRREVA